MPNQTPMTEIETKSLSVSITIERAPDLPGRWEAHCLDVDVISYGDSPRDAFRMIEEAAQMAILDDLNHDRDPLQHDAPEEAWDRLQRIADRAKKVSLETLDADPTAGGVFVLTMRLLFFREIPKLGEVIDLAEWRKKNERVLNVSEGTAEAA